jgi:branched-chain amino acid aminotransferase
MTTQFGVNPGESLVYFNGAIIPASDAKILVLSPAAQFGLSVFEGLRYYSATTSMQLYGFRIQDHYRRLMRSATLLGLSSSITFREFEDSIRKVLIATAMGSDTVVRAILIPIESGSWSYEGEVALFISCMERGRMKPAGDGLKAAFTTWRRNSESNSPPKIKMGANYINSRLGQREVNRQGCEAPIFLNERGTVAEGAGSCIAVVFDGKLISNTPTSSTLDSITLDSVMQIAKKLGIPTEKREIDRTEILTSDEAFFCGTTMEITPIKSVDGFSKTLPGKITKMLQQSYMEVVRGVSDDFRHWLS